MQRHSKVVSNKGQTKTRLNCNHLTFDNVCDCNYFTRSPSQKKKITILSNRKRPPFTDKSLVQKIASDKHNDLNSKSESPSYKKNLIGIQESRDTSNTRDKVRPDLTKLSKDLKCSFCNSDQPLMKKTVKFADEPHSTCRLCSQSCKCIHSGCKCILCPFTCQFCDLYTSPSCMRTKCSYCNLNCGFSDISLNALVSRCKSDFESAESKPSDSFSIPYEPKTQFVKDLKTCLENRRRTMHMEENPKDDIGVDNFNKCFYGKTCTLPGNSGQYTTRSRTSLA